LIHGDQTASSRRTDAAPLTPEPPAPVPRAGLLGRAKRFRRAVSHSWKNARILAFRYGQFRTMLDWASCDADGAPIPWMTYPAIEYLKQLDLSAARIFEYGSGNSSLFWAARCLALVTVEDNPGWHEKISPRLPGNARSLFRDGARYPRSILETDDRYDVVVIDGSRRKSCAEAAVERLAETGFIVLDNSDWLPRTTQFLRERDLIQVDMTGFGPINGYTLTTSFFFSRKVILRAAGAQQPVGGPGSIRLGDPSADS
jgi:hypothetical protein